MALGQISEIFFMVFSAILFQKIGVKMDAG